jgi:hypothetical protein
MGVKASKIRWKNIADGLRVVCYTPGCEAFTNQYCRRGDCKEPHCDAHKAGHRIERHTKPRLLKAAGVPIDSLPIEVLALVGKIKRQPGVVAVNVTQRDDGQFLAWADLNRDRGRREASAKRVEVALQEVFLQLRPVRR